MKCVCLDWETLRRLHDRCWWRKRSAFPFYTAGVITVLFGADAQGIDRKRLGEDT